MHTRLILFIQTLFFLQFDILLNQTILFWQSTDTDSHKKFPSKSCPLRYGAGKIQEDALNLFQAGLREYLGSYMNPVGNECGGWGITGLSVSASKIIAIPSVSSNVPVPSMCNSLEKRFNKDEYIWNVYLNMGVFLVGNFFDHKVL